MYRLFWGSFTFFTILIQFRNWYALYLLEGCINFFDMVLVMFISRYFVFIINIRRPPPSTLYCLGYRWYIGQLLFFITHFVTFLSEFSQQTVISFADQPRKVFFYYVFNYYFCFIASAFSLRGSIMLKHSLCFSLNSEELLNWSSTSIPEIKNQQDVCIERDLL